MKIKWNAQQQILGKGPLSFVYKGTFNDENVAVKRISLNHIGNKSKIVEDLLMTHGVPNIVKMLHVEDDSFYRYFTVYTDLF